MKQQKIKKRLKSIKMLVLDVDGVLTDGKVWLTSSGEEMVGFNIKDGLGIARLMQAGIEVAILSSRDSKAVEHRAKTLGLKRVHVGERDKLKALNEIAKSAGVSLEEIAYVGDDLADLEPMKAVGVAAAVSDAVDEISEVAHVRLTKCGGHGAVREFCDKILAIRGK